MVYFHRNKLYHPYEELKTLWNNQQPFYRKSYEEYAKTETGLKELLTHGEQVVLPTRRYINRASV